VRCVLPASSLVACIETSVPSPSLARFKHRAIGMFHAQTLARRKCVRLIAVVAVCQACLYAREFTSAAAALRVDFALRVTNKQIAPTRRLPTGNVVGGRRETEGRGDSRVVACANRHSNVYPGIERPRPGVYSRRGHGNAAQCVRVQRVKCGAYGR